MLSLSRSRRVEVLACVLAATALCGCSAAPGNQRIIPLNYLPSLAGDYFPLKSAAMGSTYHIYIRYPESYASKPEARYPIVYLLDGDSAFPLIAPEHLFLTYDDKLPDAIIVGVAYGSFAPPVNHRETDFGSRAADFQRFLADELIPAVEKRTKADPNRRILVGQSFGGNFVLYSAFTKPDLFWGRIASNPSARMHQDLMANPPASVNRSDLHLVVVSGTANSLESREAVLNWIGQWRKRPLPWSLDEIDIPGGTHAADFDNAYRAGLRTLFGATGGPAR
jgi:predicted alpha/beta superfamily hydrolase